MTDLDLLRRYEPVIRYTQGEMFYPCAVEGYLARCSLWAKTAEGEPRLLLARGEVTAGALAEADRRAAGADLYLQFIDDPLSPLEYQAWLNSSDHPSFSSVGRLSRVGIAGRLAEALFDFSLLVRGRVPGGTTGQAERQVRQMRAEDPRYVYYGRVVRDSGYVVLHYLFFYPMNDWRSSFHGVNDHEADWEQVFVFLTETESGEPAPQWVAFAAHDFSGDDLRRRWDDPELDIVDGTHVVVYAAAGSHAAYIEPGEYLMHVEPAVLQPIKHALRPAEAFLAESVSTGDQSAMARGDGPLLSLAFVDYARGDGLAIGPGQTAAWSPEWLSDDLPWVSGYHGLWGLDTQDPFGGERAPAGPKFNRDGTVRQAWADPLGWCGLDKVPTPARLIPDTEAAIALLTADTERLTAEIETQRAALRADGLAAQAMQGAANLAQQRGMMSMRVAEGEAAVAALSAERAELEERLRLLRDYRARASAGEPTDPQAHLRNRAVPQPPPPRTARSMDVWAAASGAVLVTAIMVLLVWRPPNWPLWVAVVVLLVGLVEAGLRGKAANYLLTVTLLLAAVTGVVLAVTYWQFVIPAALAGIFIYAFVNNLRELGSRG